MVRNQVTSTGDTIPVITDPIEGFLSGNLPSSEINEFASCPIRSLIIEPSLDGRERDLLQALDFPASPTIVCDSDTHDALGRRIATAIPGAKLAIIATPNADDATVERLIDQTRHAEGLIAVGAGTINDLVKYVSHQRRQPYVVFATAPSMNGYVTATASISRHGEKLSLSSTPPLGAFFDLSVLAKAPRRLIRAGVGDSLCRGTAEIDWLLSHYLFDTAYKSTPFTIQSQDETDLLARIEGLGSSDPDALRALVRLLILGGFGMLITGNSQPGSQGEHLISHYIDMMHKPHPGSLHGEQVGLATRTMAALQHHVLTCKNPPVLDETAVDRVALSKRFERQSITCEMAMTKKALVGNQLEALNRRLADRWPALRAAFRAKAVPLDRLRAALDTAGVASHPRDLGITYSFYREAILHARELRDRFTMLDLAADAGILEPFVEQHLFETG